MNAHFKRPIRSCNDAVFTLCGLLAWLGQTEAGRIIQWKRLLCLETPASLFLETKRLDPSVPDMFGL